MARSLLFSRFRQWLAAGLAPDRGVTRRAVLRAAAMPAMAAMTAVSQPRIAIVGGGIAGLYAAWLLERRGLRPVVYESSARTGGRMFSVTGALGDGLTTEFGGEFIDTGHAEIIGLAKHFGLERLDVQAPEERALAREAYLFGGSLRPEHEILSAFNDLAPRLARDFSAAGSFAAQSRFDRLSIEAYLDSLGVSGWMRSLFDAAYTTEYGLDIGSQSAMNLISLGAGLLDGRIRWFGESDERHKIIGGNQRIPQALAGDLKAPVASGHTLEAIAARGTGYRLAFQRAGGAVDVDADIVLLALPFSILRRVAIRVPLPPPKRAAIQQLGYGVDSKVMFGVNRRVWRDLGYGGNLFSDEPFQLAWDSSRRQAGEHGSVTMLAGGRRGLEMGEGSIRQQVARLIPGVAKAWHGIDGLLNGKEARFHWPSYPHTMAAYSCYMPGQWTRVRGHEFAPVGRLHFAGEHTSRDFQGFMEGGAESGKRAAAAIAAQAGVAIGR